MSSFKLVWRNLLRRPLRSILTVLSLVVAIFLICGLRTLVTTLSAGVDYADSRRLAAMSAVSLFGALPVKYQAEIERVPGVEMTTKFQWFGGYYRSQKNFFAQFAIDPETVFSMYPELEVAPEEIEAFKKNRTSCIIGRQLADEFGWKVGDTVPIIGSLHPHPDDTAWEFQVAGIYRTSAPNFDNRTMWFHWDYLEKTLEQGGTPPSVGVFSIRIERGANVEQVITDVEAAFASSDQRVNCQTEAEFSRQFVTMFGNVPLFLSWIGTGVVIAILVATINTMLMAMREQSMDVGIMKALGFTDGAMFGTMLAQALFLCALGGGLGMLLAWATQGTIADALAAMFPGFFIKGSTFAIAACVTLLIGLLAGILPAWGARNLRCVEALRGTD